MEFFLVCAWAGAEWATQQAEAQVNWSTLDGHEQYAELRHDAWDLYDAIKELEP